MEDHHRLAEIPALGLCLELEDHQEVAGPPSIADHLTEVNPLRSGAAVVHLVLHLVLHLAAAAVLHLAVAVLHMAVAGLTMPHRSAEVLRSVGPQVLVQKQPITRMAVVRT